MFIHFSHTQYTQVIGYRLHDCHACDQQQPFGVYELTQSDAIYGIKIMDTLLQRFESCEVCGTVNPLNKKAAVSMTTEWRVGVPIENLAQLTGVQVRDPNRHPINDKSLTALMSRVMSMAHKFDGNITIMGWAAGVIGGVVGGAIAWVLWLVSVAIGTDKLETLAVLCPTLGILAGIIIRTITEIAARNRDMYHNELLFSMRKWGISVDRIGQALDREMVNSEKADRILQRLAAEK